MPRLEGDPSKFPLTLDCDRSTRENKTGNWRSIRPVIDAEKCTGCLLCWKFCPDACVRIEGERPVIDLDYCKGCMICANECPAKCIAIEEEEAR
ncbi:MAG: 4Fe-4S binding protein [Elusimicrobiota bacterium]